MGGCGQMLRKNKETIGAFPGTLIERRVGVCRACHVAGFVPPQLVAPKSYGRPTVPIVGLAADQVAVLDLVHSRLAGSDADQVALMLGLAA